MTRPIPVVPAILPHGRLPWRNVSSVFRMRKFDIQVQVEPWRWRQAERASWRRCPSGWVKGEAGEGGSEILGWCHLCRKWQKMFVHSELSYSRSHCFNLWVRAVQAAWNLFPLLQGGKKETRPDRMCLTKLGRAWELRQTLLPSVPGRWNQWMGSQVKDGREWGELGSTPPLMAAVGECEFHVP